MDPTLEQALMAFFNSRPDYVAEYNRVRTTMGDRRSAAEWLYDHISTHPEDRQNFQSFNTSQQQQEGNLSGDVQESEVQTESVPLEQALLQQALPGLMADVQSDEQRALLAQAMTAQAQGDYDLVRQLVLRATSGQQLQGELSMADETARARGQALVDQLDKLRAAQAPLSTARINEAEAGATGINLGLERTQDALTADRALQGYVGGSTMDDAALLRATIDARQRAAGVVGAARTANATDERNIGGYGASQGYTIADELARQRQGLYNADYGRSLQAALSLPQVTGQFINLQGQIDAQRNAGLRRTQDALNWWSTNSQAPTATYNPVTPDGSGNDIAGLGANLVSAGFNIANANNWWQTPAAPKSSASGVYQPPLGGNANSAAYVRSN